MVIRTLVLALLVVGIGTIYTLGAIASNGFETLLEL